MRYIIECENSTDIILGMKCIKHLQNEETKDAILQFDNGSLWYVKKTKTGYSARTAE